MPSRNRTFFLAILLAIAFSFFRANFDVQPIKSQNDEKQYSYLQLDNSLQVLLISDSKADHGAASLDVNVGSLQDPKSRAGLAHFLEHMLFLGTETYPVAGEYQSFISQHGGSHNAFTASEHTNYFFEIDDSQLHGALKRFSRFFYEPLFSEEYVQREKGAVNSEYKSKYKDDYRRQQYVLKSLMNPEHPASHFATGSLETLSDTESTKIRDDLLTFYNQYYSANLMTLVIYGPQNIKTLKQWAQNLFSPINNQNTALTNYPQTLFQELPLDIQIQPVKSLYSLSFIFPLNQALNEYSKKTTQYIGHILGHEGEGSLLAWLKKQGWAEGLSAGVGNKIRNNGTFQISIRLSQEGLKHKDEISQQVFAYVRLLKEQGVKQWAFDENQQLATLAFRFQEGQKPSSLVQSLSMSMHEYSSQDILQGPYLWQEFDAASIQNILTKLNPTNVIRSFVSPNVKSEQYETWFNAPFTKSKISNQIQKEWQETPLAEGLFIPQANPFIPQNTDTITTAKQASPSLILKEAGLEVWHMSDLEFKGPQSSIFINLRSPLMQNSADEQVLIDAWMNLLNDKLNSFSYPALLAGQSYSLYSHMRGLGIRLYGYRDKQDVLLTKILDEMLNFEPNQMQWLQTQQELMRSYDNALKQKPFKRTLAKLSQTLLQPSFGEVQLQTAIKKASLKDVLAIKQTFFNKLHLVMLAHGNIEQSQTLEIAQLLKQKILSNNEPTPVFRKQVSQLQHSLKNMAIEAQHDDSVMTLYYQAQNDGTKERATLGLIAQIIKAPYYTYMRTEKKYGYIVFASAYPMLEQGGLAFIVQSPNAQAGELLSETLMFIENFVQALEAMTAEEYMAHQKGLMSNLLKKPLNLEQKSNRFWSEIDRENDQFNTLEQLAQHVEELTQEELIAYVRQYLIGNNKKSLNLHFDAIRK